MGMKVLPAKKFTRHLGEGKKTIFSASSVATDIRSGTANFIFENTDNKQYLFKLFETKVNEKGKVLSWNYRNAFYGDKVEVVISVD